MTLWKVRFIGQKWKLLTFVGTLKCISQSQGHVTYFKRTFPSCPPVLFSLSLYRYKPMKRPVKSCLKLFSHKFASILIDRCSDKCTEVSFIKTCVTCANHASNNAGGPLKSRDNNKASVLTGDWHDELQSEPRHVTWLCTRHTCLDANPWLNFYIRFSSWFHRLIYIIKIGEIEDYRWACFPWSSALTVCFLWRSP